MYRLFLLLLISAVLQGSFPPGSGPSKAGDTNLYYFNPDSAISNLGRLKLEMEKLFDRSGYPVSFQAFTCQTDLDARISELRPKFLFAPEWYIKNYGRKLKLRPFLVPVHKGTATYRKVLLAANSSQITLDSVQTHSLAMTSAGPDTRTFLYHTLFPVPCEETCPFNPIIVPKSTDALFALILGHVDLALVVQEHLEKLKQVLPRIIGGVRPLVLSNPIPMPMLCYSEERVTPAEIEKCKSVFLGAQNEKIRSDLSELLTIDEWRETSK